MPCQGVRGDPKTRPSQKGAVLVSVDSVNNDADSDPYDETDPGNPLQRG